MPPDRSIGARSRAVRALIDTKYSEPYAALAAKIPIYGAPRRHHASHLLVDRQVGSCGERQALAAIGVLIRSRFDDGAWARVAYLKCDGVTRDGADGQMFDASSDTADEQAFAERTADDRHHFRFRDHRGLDGNRKPEAIGDAPATRGPHRSVAMGWVGPECHGGRRR